MSAKDVTALVDFENNDDECLPLTKCVCGHVFEAWDFIIGIYSDQASECPECGAKLYFRNEIRVYQVVEDAI